MLPLNSLFGSDSKLRRIGIVCILLLLASAVNYMDRQTLSVAAARIKDEFKIDSSQYGRIEEIFGYSFAFGSLFWGFVVDRFSVRWIYPIGLLGWSTMGFLTGWVQNYDELYWCRLLLGFFESAHWPCGLKTTQALLSRQGRAMGNSVLQSGTSLGAILTPIVMLAILTPEPGSWRFGFQLIALVGASWIFLWLFVVRESDFVQRHQDGQNQDGQNQDGHAQHATASKNASASPWWSDVFTSRFVIVLIMIICINTMWQVVRAWLPLIMQENYGFSERQTLLFNSLWYLCTDVGCFASGLLALTLGVRGWSIKSARLTALLVCVVCFSSIIAVPFLNRKLANREVAASRAAAAASLENSSPSPVGLPVASQTTLTWSEEFQAILALEPIRIAMLCILLLSGAGALGIFPIYYSFAQDVSQEHQGKVTSLSALGGWLVSSYAQPLFGKLKDQTGTYDIGIWIISVLPVIPLIVLWLFWHQEPAVSNESSTLSTKA
jgi:ACS family hexuronate transporter-like MFS transporter